MKKIVIKLLIMIIILFVADRLIVHFFINNIFSKTLSGEKSSGPVNYLIQKKKNISFLVLGSSRAKHQIDPALLTNVYSGNGYNAGIDGIGGLIYNSMLLQLLLNKGIKPNLVILHIDSYPYLTAKDDNITYELSQLYPYINESPALSNYINGHSGFAEKIKLLFHTYRYNGKLLNILFNYPKRNSIKDNNGFEPIAGKLDTTGFKLPDDLNIKHTYSEIKLNALNEIVQTCKLNDIKLVVVFSPSYKNNNLLKQGNGSIIESLKQQGILNIYDLSDVEKIPALQPPAVWRDITHLNDSGAVIFSRMLNDSLGSLR